MMRRRPRERTLEEKDEEASREDVGEFLFFFYSLLFFFLEEKYIISKTLAITIPKQIDIKTIFPNWKSISIKNRSK